MTHSTLCGGKPSLSFPTCGVRAMKPQQAWKRKDSGSAGLCHSSSVPFGPEGQSASAKATQQDGWAGVVPVQYGFGPFTPRSAKSLVITVRAVPGQRTSQQDPCHAH